MPIIKKINNKSPKIGENCFIAENATIIGDVIIGNNCSLWYNSVIRGDIKKIIIGNNVNIQDGTIIHTSSNASEVYIGDNVTIGHNAIIHSAIIKNNVLIGMGSIILDNSVIEDNVIVAAGSIVPPSKHLESGYLYMGIPVKKVKKINDETKELIQKSVESYLNLILLYKVNNDI